MHFSPGLTKAGSSGDPVNVKVENISGSVINPATEETVESIAGFNIPKYDYIKVTYPDGVTEVYTFKIGGSGGSTVGTITLVYTDSTKANLDTAIKS